MQHRFTTAVGVRILVPLLLAISLACPADVVSARLMTLELARDIAWNVVDACRKEGHQVSVVVTDRSGEPLVVMRDVFSNKFLTSVRPETPSF